jgi:hypothetical protein
MTCKESTAPSTTAWRRFVGPAPGYAVGMPGATSDPPDDHRELFEAEREEAEVEEEREEEAERRTDRVHEEYEAEKDAPG